MRSPKRLVSREGRTVHLKEISEARGVSGDEGAVRQVILDIVRELIEDSRRT